jgi:hypothetical protein
MDYPNLVYGLLQSLAWSITPALPTGAPGTRPAVGAPEKIPDVTFIARTVTLADGIRPDDGRTPAEEVARLNGFIDDGRIYHELYGLGPIPMNSFEAILKHFENLTTPIGRIRFVSHGNDSYLFFPMFENGDWDDGIQEDLLKALQNSDESGIRFLLTRDPLLSPLLVDIVGTITDRIRVRNSAMLAPFGIQAAGAAPAQALPYFQIVNDLYQANHGTVIIDTAGVTTAVTTAQRTTLITAFTVIERLLRRALEGTVFDAVAITDTQIAAFRDAVLAVPPGPFGLFGAPKDLAAGTVAAVAAATAAAPQVEADIRTAFAGAADSPVFGIDHLSDLVRSLETFSAAALNLGGGPQTEADIRADPDLLTFALVGVDLFLLKNGFVLQNGATLTPGEVTTLRNGLNALAAIVRTRLLAVAGTPFTAARLNAFRDALGNIPYRQSTLLGFATIDSHRLKLVGPAAVAMQAGFRGKLDHFRGLMQPADASALDIRGCLVGAAPQFLITLRDFLGTAAGRPVVSAPEWLQRFPRGGLIFRFGTPLAPIVDALATTGSPPDITGADVSTAAATWRGLIDFDPHFDFITSMFAIGASKRDFASLRWRVFKTAAAPQGIPVLRMEASRVDTIDTLTLAQVIERLRDIFDIPAAGVPSTTTRGQLTSLQPHVVGLKSLNDAIVAAVAPTAPQLTQFIADLTTLLGKITAIGMPGPASPTAPAGATLPDVQNFAAAIGTYVDALLDGALTAFFAAMQTAIGEPNAPLTYFYNVGLPLLLQSGGSPTVAAVSTCTSSTGAAANTQIGNAVRSWMRIQWQGSAAQAGTMNARISAVPMGTEAQRRAAAQFAMLNEEPPGTRAAVAPMPDFDAHIVKEPP